MQNPHVLRIVQQIDDKSVSGLRFRLLLNEFAQSLKDCVRREANQSLELLAPTLKNRNVSRASWVAAVCNAMVESGCDSQVLARPLAKGLKRALHATMPLAAKMEKKVAPKLVDVEDPDIAQRWIQSGLRQLAVRLPEASASLKTAERFCKTAMTVYAQQVDSRRKVWRYLREFLDPVAAWSQPLADLRTLLNVLENEKLIVIDVAQRKGFVGTFGGAVDNAQLLILVMDTYIKQLVFGKPLVSHDVAQCAKGIGPTEVSDPVHGAWNIYSYLALSPLQKLPEPNDLKANKHWIWNEKTPDQIPALDGFRILLLGPPSYPRSWGFSRRFKHLQAGIRVDNELSRLDIQAWLDRICQQNYAQSTRTA